MQMFLAPIPAFFAMLEMDGNETQKAAYLVSVAVPG